ncbi:MAG TPA: hypothetical protein VFQ87_20975, partial [Bradyrhizobium sp.]|nr:hypothetical protein [Bradyrhizobium sp.]
MSRFFAAVAADGPKGEKPPVHAARVDVGVGKSLVARRGAAEMLTRMRTQGDKGTVVFAVPTHALSVEAVAA